MKLCVGLGSCVSSGVVGLAWCVLNSFGSTSWNNWFYLRTRVRRSFQSRITWHRQNKSDCAIYWAWHVIWKDGVTSTSGTSPKLSWSLRQWCTHFWRIVSSSIVLPCLMICSSFRRSASPVDGHCCRGIWSCRNMRWLTICGWDDAHRVWWILLKAHDVFCRWCGRASKWLCCNPPRPIERSGRRAWSATPSSCHRPRRRRSARCCRRRWKTCRSMTFVLVDHEKRNLSTAPLLRAPREEYEAAVRSLQERSLYYKDVEVRVERLLREEGDPILLDCVLETDGESALARRLSQTGSADAQGQDAGESEEEESRDGMPVVEDAGILDGFLCCDKIVCYKILHTWWVHEMKPLFLYKMLISAI